MLCLLWRLLGQRRANTRHAGVAVTGHPKQRASTRMGRCLKALHGTVPRRHHTGAGIFLDAGRCPAQQLGQAMRDPCDMVPQTCALTPTALPPVFTRKENPTETPCLFIPDLIQRSFAQACCSSPAPSLCQPRTQSLTLSLQPAGRIRKRSEQNTSWRSQRTRSPPRRPTKS